MNDGEHEGVEAFGELLKQFRVSRGLSQCGLAKLVGCDHSAVSFWEHDERHPQRTSVRLLVRALRLDGEERDRFWALAGFIPPDLEPAVVLAACRAIREEQAAA